MLPPLKAPERPAVDEAAGATPTEEEIAAGAAAPSEEAAAEAAAEADEAAKAAKAAEPSAIIEIGPRHAPVKLDEVIGHSALNFQAFGGDYDVNKLSGGLRREVETLDIVHTLDLSGSDGIRGECLESLLELMPGLTKLDISGLFNLKYLPDSFGELLPNLVDLCIRQARLLPELPASITKLGKLETLDLRECDKLAALPADVGSLSALRRLYLSQSNSRTGARGADLGDGITKLPESFYTLVELQHLEMQCPNLGGLAEEVGADCF